MKLSSLFASALAVVAVAACAVSAPEEQEENTGTTEQGLCVGWPNCTVKTFGGRLGGDLTTSSSGMVLDPGTGSTSSSSSGGDDNGGLGSGESFDCSGTFAECTMRNHHLYLVCIDKECKCNVCGVIPNGLNFGTFNPCRQPGSYTCDPWGRCACR